MSDLQEAIAGMKGTLESEIDALETFADDKKESIKVKAVEAVDLSSRIMTEKLLGRNTRIAELSLRAVFENIKAQSGVEAATYVRSRVAALFESVFAATIKGLILAL